MVVSGETVTAKLILAPLPVPPPLPPSSVQQPPMMASEPEPEIYQGYADEQPTVSSPEPQAVAEPEKPEPKFLLSVTPLDSSAARSRGGRKTEPAKNNSGLWIGGGIGLLAVAVLASIGYVLKVGSPGGPSKLVARSPKTGEGKNKATTKSQAPAAEPPAITEHTNTVPPVTAAADVSPPSTTTPTLPTEPTPEPPTTPVPETPSSVSEIPAAKPAPETPTPEQPAPETPVPEKPTAQEPEPAKVPPAKEKTKPDKAAPKTGGKKMEPKKPAAKGPPPATADCEVCRGRGLVPLKNPQPYVWMEGQPVPKGALAVREQYCPNCKPDAANAEFAAAEDLRLKTAMEVHVDWEKKTNWPLVRAENRRAALHSQLPPTDTQRVALALEAMNQHIEGLTGSLELTSTTPANCNIIILFQKPNYLQFVNLLKADPVFGPARQDWSLVGEVAGTWVKDTIFYRYSPEGPPPEHQGVALMAAFQIRTACGYKDPPWLNVGYSAYCENMTLKANRVNSLEYALNNLQIDPDWSLAVRRLAAAGGLKPWNDMFPKLLRDYQAEDHLTAYTMVAFLIQYKPQKFLDFIKETKSGLGSAEALEKAYGETVPQLQQRWVKALGGR